jgi:uncharacterized protein
MITKIKFGFLLAFMLTGSISLFALSGYVEPWGRDADLGKKQEIITPVKLSPMGWIAEKVILFHQNVLTKVDGPRSHFRPTSSRYMLLAIRRHGFMKGFVMGCDRLLRENEEEWVYREVLIDGNFYKWDPVPSSSPQLPILGNLFEG